MAIDRSLPPSVVAQLDGLKPQAGEACGHHKSPLTLAREALEAAKATIIHLVNARGSEAEGSDEEWTGQIDTALTALSGAGEAEPRAFVVEQPGERPSVVDARTYDPRKREFWTTDEAQAAATVHCLYLSPSPDGWEAAIEACRKELSAFLADGRAETQIVRSVLDKKLAALKRPSSEPQGDRWRDWVGGENPAPGQTVEYRMRENPFKPTDTQPSDELRWEHIGQDSDIISYRVLPPPPAEQGAK